MWCRGDSGAAVCVLVLQSATFCCMSKSIRLKQHLVDELERLAVEEKRSLANMVEVLLEQALRLDGEIVTRRVVQTEPVFVEAQMTSTRRTERRREAEADLHFKPDPKGGR